MTPPPTIDLGHTPGIYYALSYWLSTMTYLSVLPLRVSKRRIIWISALFLLGMCAFMSWTDGAYGVSFILTMLTIFALIFALTWLCAEADWRKALYFSTRAFILGEFAASFEYQMFYFGLTSMGLPLNMWVNFIFLIPFHSLVFGLCYVIERRFREWNDSLTVTGQELAVVLSTTLLVYILSNLSYVIPDTPFSGREPRQIFAIHTMTDLSGVWLLLAFHLQKYETGERMEKEYLRKLLHMQKENYRMSAESIELVNRKYHDLKHQIQLLRSEISSEGKLRYLDEMEQEIRSFETQNKTGNKVLDTLLMAKSIKCQNLGISITCVADGKELDYIKPTDLSVLFGNALDNAIESAEKIKDAGKRLIHVSVVRQKSFVRIRIENTYEGDIRFADGLPVTAKDARYHGYGMKSMRSVVEKYDGSMTIKAQDGWFELRILLPAAEAPDGPETTS